MGDLGIFPLTTLAIGSYLLINLMATTSTGVERHWLLMRCLVIGGVAAVAANQAKQRQKELIRLSQVYQSVEHAILSNTKLDQILNMILGKALEFTNSEAGHIRLFNKATGRYEIVTAIGDEDNNDWSRSDAANQFSDRVAAEKQQLTIARIGEARWSDFLPYFRSGRNPQSAIFCPISLRDVSGIIAVYSNWGQHYGQIDARRLTTLAALAEMALKTLELSEAELYYRELIDKAPDPMIVLDHLGNIKVFNKACQDLWDYSYDDVVGKPVANYYESEEHARHIGGILWKAPEHRIKDFEARIKAKDGEIIPISLSACFIEKDKKRDRDIGVFKDRRKSIKMAEDILQAEQLALVGRLAGTVGHDVKHKIATALNYLSVLSDTARDPKLSALCDKIKNKLEESVAEFNKVLRAHEPGPPQKTLVRVNEIFQKIDESMRVQALDKNIAFVVNYPQPDIQVLVDSEQLERVLANLFTNSLHAIERRREIGGAQAGGRIEVSAQLNQNHVHLTWKDDGCGVPAQESSSIFNAFVTSKGNKGTGLGLFIVKSMIQNHDGRIELESKLGDGATFHVMLPHARTVGEDADRLQEE